MAAALPLDEAGKYVAAAYVVFLALILVYVAIMAAKLQRLTQEITALTEAVGAGEEAAREEQRVEVTAP
jgi:hypothetical protein